MKREEDLFKKSDKELAKEKEIVDLRAEVDMLKRQIQEFKDDLKRSEATTQEFKDKYESAQRVVNTLASRSEFRPSPSET